MLIIVIFSMPPFLPILHPLPEMQTLPRSAGPPCQLPAVPFLEKGSEGCWELIASQKLLARRVPRGLELLADCQARPTSSGLIKASYGFQAFFLLPPPPLFHLCSAIVMHSKWRSMSTQAFVLPC